MGKYERLNLTEEGFKSNNWMKRHGRPMKRRKGFTGLKTRGVRKTAAPVMLNAKKRRVGLSFLGELMEQARKGDEAALQKYFELTGVKVNLINTEDKEFDSIGQDKDFPTIDDLVEVLKEQEHDELAENLKSAQERFKERRKERHPFTYKEQILFEGERQIYKFMALQEEEKERVLAKMQEISRKMGPSGTGKSSYVILPAIEKALKEKTEEE